MKSITLLPATLQKALKIVAPAINPRTTLPILTNVKVDVKKNGIVFTANNQDLVIEHTVPYENDDNFSFCAPFDVFQNIIQVCVDDITIEKKGNKLIITSGVNNFNIVTEDVKDFLVTPSANGSEDLVLPDNLMRSISNAYMSVGTTKAGHGTENVLLDVNTEGINVVSSDRCILFKEPLKAFDNKPVKLLLSYGLVKAIKDYPNVHQVRYINGKVFFLFENTKYICTMSAATYVDYNSFIPIGEPNILFDLDTAVKALNSVSVVGTTQFAPILDAVITKDKFELKLENPIFNYNGASSFEIESTCPVEKICFTATFMLNALKHFEALGIKKVKAFISDPLKSIVFSADNCNVTVSIGVSTRG